MITITLAERHEIACFMGLCAWLYITGSMIQIIMTVHREIMKEKRNIDG